MAKPDIKPIKAPCILSYSAMFLTGEGGGSVSLPIEYISCTRDISFSVKPIGSSNLDSLDRPKLVKIIKSDIVFMEV